MSHSVESEESCCGPTCNCNPGGPSNAAKMVVCLLVAVAAVAVVWVNLAKKTPAGTAAYSVPAVSTLASPTATPFSDKKAASPEQAEVWGPTVSSLAALNEVAVDTDAVFIFLPARDGKQTETIRALVEAAAKKSRLGGSATMAYTLSCDAPDYEQLTRKSPAPCVVGMARGAGAVVVTGDITEAKLLQALVAATRPSSCGPGGCSSGCK